MISALVGLIVLVSVLLVLSVLVQNSKGGGVASGYGISTNEFGVRKTADFLEKSTWVLVGALLVLSLSVNSLYVAPEEDSEMPKSINAERAKESGAGQLPSAPSAEKATDSAAQ